MDFTPVLGCGHDTQSAMAILTPSWRDLISCSAGRIREAHSAELQLTLKESPSLTAAVFFIWRPYLARLSISCNAKTPRFSRSPLHEDLGFIPSNSDATDISIPRRLTDITRYLPLFCCLLRTLCSAFPRVYAKAEERQCVKRIYPVGHARQIFSRRHQWVHVLRR